MVLEPTAVVLEPTAVFFESAAVVLELTAVVLEPTAVFFESAAVVFELVSVPGRRMTLTGCVRAVVTGVELFFGAIFSAGVVFLVLCDVLDRVDIVLIASPVIFVVFVGCVD